MTCPQCGGAPEEPGCDPVNGPKEPCRDPIHRIAYDVAHGARWINKEDEGGSDDKPEDFRYLNDYA